MSTTMTEKRGDTRTRELTLNRPISAGADVRVFLRRRKDPAVTMTHTVVDPAAGRIAVTFDGALPVGEYNLEVQVTEGAVIATFPTDGFVLVRIVQDIAD